MKKAKIAIVLLAMIVLLASCDLGLSDYTDGKKDDIWLLEVIEYEYMDKVPAYIPGYVHPSSDGYQWLLVHIAITNLQNTNDSMPWVFNTFKFEINDQVYSLRLQLNDPPGYISTSYNPNQRKTGFIAFEIEEGLDASTGKLKFIPDVGSEVTKSMASVPKKD